MTPEPISALYKAGYAYVRAVPEPVARASAALASVATANLSAERRLLVERHLRRAHGQQYGGTALRRSVHETFRSYGRYWVDSFRLPGLTPEQIDAGMSVTGFGHIAEARARGIGPILVLPHLGGWEWAGFYVTRTLGIPVTVVVEPVEPAELFEFFVDFRQRLGMSVVPLGPTAAGEVLRAIKRTDVVCLLADRDIQGDGIPVTFFGERTTMPAGPATLALRTGAPLLPGAIYFTPDAHRAVIEPPLPAERRGRFRDDVARVTQLIADRLEDLIRAAPEQWHLQQPNWPSDYDALEAIGKPSPRPGRLRPRDRAGAAPG
jgi:phosphatidylinositol dimannoside acyltransferase